MTISIEARSSGWGPREMFGWIYPPSHTPLNDGRVAAYLVKCSARKWPRDGVTITIRREP